MANFHYKAKRGPTEIVEGDVQAERHELAVQKIIQMGLTPINITEIHQRPAKIKSLSFDIFSSHVPLSQKAGFTRQMSDLVEASVPILRALGIAANQTRHAKLKEIILDMQNRVKDGSSFSQALSKHSNVFPPLYINMVRSGEISGKLTQVLVRLADFLERDLETRGKIQQSLAYPLLIMGVGIFTVFILLAFIVPRISFIFEDFNQQLPLPTVIVMALAGFFAKFWWLILAFIALIIFYTRRWLQTPSGKEKFSRWQLQTPVLGDFIRDTEVALFSRTLGTLLESGVVIVEALKSVWNVLNNEIFKKEIQKVSEEVASGSHLSKALKTCKYFPEAAINIVAVGEETGHLEKGLHKLADTSERQAERMSKTLISLFGPLILIFVILFIGGVVIAMLLPLLQMNLVVR